MIEKVLQIINNIEFHRYKNSWKSIHLLPTELSLDITLSNPYINLSRLYITNVPRSYIESIELSKYNILIIDEKYLINQVELDQHIDFNLIYILKVSDVNFKIIHDQIIKNYNSRKSISKSEAEIKRYKDSSNTTSRYSLCSRIVYDNEEIQESMDRIIIPRTTEDRFHEVSAKDENRMDLISYAYYGTPRYWWAISYASNIYDPLDIPIGTILRIPPRREISKILGGARV